ncbi:MAG: 2-oxoacid:acceptor oxidoreductase family protein [Candidatus Thermoplasmatota archaeon]|nr:2-oxoacid:acceptor oxidoreductase family protein [Candidatus Thermoplasmatota archaeon]
MFEIRFHGRGGQGAVTASKILALAAFMEGRYVISFPFFGTERRGAPVTAFTRIDDGPILLKTQIYNPDAVVVLDTYVMTSANVKSGMKNGSYLIVNTEKEPGEIDADHRTATVDATRIATELGLGDRTNPIINTAMIGAFARASGIISRESAIEAVKSLSPRNKEKNAEAAGFAFNETRLGWGN